ncbi:hypothetical protein ABIA33_000996 [Streptacidiphilus sp. MAP12-16]|uniref:hypothetical protein n=1 Tax=Streptacidiphilus sp. MAP12-16 TaxID=3156300 RepID=UPI003519908E
MEAVQLARYTQAVLLMSLMIDNPIRRANRHRAHAFRSPAPAPAPAPAHSLSAPPWADEETWDEDDTAASSDPASGQASAPASGPISGPASGPISGPISGLTNGPTSGPAYASSNLWWEPAPEPRPAPAVPVPSFGTRPSDLPCDAPSVPPTRAVAAFPPIRAGGGRHRLPAAVRRRPGPIAAGLMVAATTLAAGSLRNPTPPATTHTTAGAALHDGTGGTQVRSRPAG